MGLLAGRLRGLPAHGAPLAARFDLPRLLERFPLSDAQGALDAARAGEVGKAVLVPDMV